MDYVNLNLTLMHPHETVLYNKVVNNKWCHKVHQGQPVTQKNKFCYIVTMITGKHHIKTSHVLHIRLGAVLYKNSLVSNSFWHQVFSIHTTWSSNKNWYGLCQSEFDTDASSWNCFVQWWSTTSDVTKFNKGNLWPRKTTFVTVLQHWYKQHIKTSSQQDQDQLCTKSLLCQIRFYTKVFHTICMQEQSKTQIRLGHEKYSCVKFIFTPRIFIAVGLIRKTMHAPNTLISRFYIAVDLIRKLIQGFIQYFHAKQLEFFCDQSPLFTLFMSDVTKFILGRLLVLIICSHKFFQNVFHAYRSTLFSAHMDKKNL